MNRHGIAGVLVIFLVSAWVPLTPRFVRAGGVKGGASRVRWNVPPVRLPVQRPVVIAHRGASAYLPEHTLAAKALAHGMNPDYIEQDVVLTRDSVPVILHDHYLDTVTDVAAVFPGRARKDGRYYAIDFTLAEIKRLRVFERIDLKTGKPVFGDRFPATGIPFRVPTLEEELQLIQGLNKSRRKNIGIYVELKAPWFHKREGKDIAAVVLPVLYRYGYTGPDDRCFVQCFDPSCLKYMKYILRTRLRLVQLIADNDWNETPGVDYEAMTTREGLAAIAAYADGVGPWIPQLVKVTDRGRLEGTGLVRWAHQAGLLVHPYTVRADSLPEWASSVDELFDLLFRRLGVDGVFSDFPDLAVKCRDAFVAGCPHGRRRTTGRCRRRGRSRG